MSHLVPKITKISTYNHLKQLHLHLIQNSLHHHNYWVSLLINHCTRTHAPPLFARHLFNSTPNPTISVFISILKYYSHSGLQYELLAFFKHIINCNVKLDASLYPLVIKSSGRDGVMFYAHILKLGHQNDPYIRNVMLDVYVKHCPIEFAKKLFDEMPERSVADWNSMISGYWKWGNEGEACRLFGMMPERNVITWTAMVAGFSKIKEVQNARKYFDDMPVKSIVSWNAMLSGYAQNGLSEEALKLFGCMMTVGVQPNETTWTIVISSCSFCGDPCLAESIKKLLDGKGVKINYFVKTALLDMNAKCGNLEAARNIFDELGVSRNSVAWNAMISAFTKAGDLLAARDLFDKMPVRDAVSWNTMISGYAQNGQSATAVELFREMIDTKDMQPDEVTMVSVISACGHLGALELGTWAVKFIYEYKIKLTVSGYNSLIFMYSKCGNMKEARRIFQEMEKKDVVSYNTLIGGFAAHGQGYEAVKLLKSMEEEGIEPDRVTYICVLTACSHAGLVEEGHKVFESIKITDVDHYACMVDMLGRVGKLNEAKRLIDNMPMEAHAGIYGSLLNASRVHRRVEVGEVAAEMLFSLEPQNSGNYVLLSNIYASLGRWEDVNRVREMMRKAEVKKTAGWSWVEYKGKVHKFMVGDRSHERSDDIYRVLAELGSRMRKLGYTADRRCVLRDVEEEEKDNMVGSHSEKLAICFALLVSEAGAAIRVVKNLRVCLDCHTAIKMISKLEGREIIVRDNNRFHHFVDGICSCNDYW
ncbi:pentatricopeptide repeat-containing protein At1g14470 [Mercurialis annua]|uniref:pentatricopeptide repeat-containing protein At1g14470 n=1 Tax=Mercurialis annua TaxID=3986 RepID=UPI00215E8F86|nr:pentatricopeptide repeat-containing protein At1g14470 [Mercurialis annua]